MSFSVPLPSFSLCWRKIRFHGGGIVLREAPSLSLMLSRNLFPRRSPGDGGFRFWFFSAGTTPPWVTHRVFLEQELPLFRAHNFFPSPAVSVLPFWFFFFCDAFFLFSRHPLHPSGRYRGDSLVFFCARRMASPWLPPILVLWTIRALFFFSVKLLSRKKRVGFS